MTTYQRLQALEDKICEASAMELQDVVDHLKAEHARLVEESKVEAWKESVKVGFDPDSVRRMMAKNHTRLQPN